jgi:hypothetical protein
VLTSSSRVAERHQPGADRQSGFFKAGERDMARVVRGRPGETRERKAPRVGGCCERRDSRPGPIVAGYDSCAASEGDLHDELARKRQERILMPSRRGRRSASAERGSISS